jgi:Flp pilus assembly pilin Flp
MRLPLSRLPGGIAGTSSVEYAVIATLISLAAFAVILSIGTSVSGFFGSVASAI